MLNLEPSIAVTQNFVSTANFQRCVKDMALGSDHFHANVRSYFSHSCMQAWGWPIKEEAADADYHDTVSVNEAGSLYQHGDGSCSDDSGGRARKRLKQPQLQQLQHLESPLKQVEEVSPGHVDNEPATTISAAASASPGLVEFVATATTAATAPSRYPLHRRSVEEEASCVPVLRVCVTVDPTFTDSAVLLKGSPPSMMHAPASPAPAAAAAALLDGTPMQRDKHLGPWLRKIWQAMPEMRPAVQVCVCVGGGSELGCFRHADCTILLSLDVRAGEPA